jgi:predicted nucleotide-binding protein
MIRCLVPGLKDGSVKDEWIVSEIVGEDITEIFDLDTSDTRYNIWRRVRRPDFDDFVECGLFRPLRYNDRSVPTIYSLHKQRIIDLVESNFGESAQRSASEKTTMTVKDPKTVFVIHGRNETIRRAFFDFLRSIGLNPLEWSQAVSRTGSPSPSIREILDTAFREAQAIVALMTPDDEARLRMELQKDDDGPDETRLTPQARANVIFEAGMAMARSPNQTILVELGKLRRFSDVAGIHVIRLNNSTEMRQQLAERFENAGCPINLSGTDWHKAGDFEIKLQLTAEE